MTDIQINAYTWQMNLTINKLQKSDFGSYVCSSINALGKADASVRLQGNAEKFLYLTKLKTFLLLQKYEKYSHQRRQRRMFIPRQSQDESSTTTRPGTKRENHQNLTRDPLMSFRRMNLCRGFHRKVSVELFFLPIF